MRTTGPIIPATRSIPNSSEEELQAAFKRLIDDIWERHGDQSVGRKVRYGAISFRAAGRRTSRVRCRRRCVRRRQPGPRSDLAAVRQPDVRREQQDADQRRSLADLAGGSPAPPGRHRREVAQGGRRNRYRRGTAGGHSRDGDRGRHLLVRQYQPHLRNREVHRRPAAVPSSPRICPTTATSAASSSPASSPRPCRPTPSCSKSRSSSAPARRSRISSL